jgi:hypothetical protein
VCCIGGLLRVAHLFAALPPLLFIITQQVVCNIAGGLPTNLPGPATGSNDKHHFADFLNNEQTVSHLPGPLMVQ